MNPNPLSQLLGQSRVSWGELIKESIVSSVFVLVVAEILLAILKSQYPVINLAPASAGYAFEIIVFLSSFIVNLVQKKYYTDKYAI